MSDTASYFDASTFMPHGHCYFWRPDILVTHIVADGLIALSYFTIPIALVTLVMRRRDLHFNWAFSAFAAFILLCGLTHVFGIWVVWHPDYGVQGILKAITATVSVVTAVLVWPLVPKAIALPSTAELERANAKLHSLTSDLEHKVAERTRELRALNETLEDRVRDRTRELEAINRELEAFSYSVSHDLRAPLRSINGFSDVLMRRHADSLDQDGMRYLVRVREAATRMDTLIDDLLTLARLARCDLRKSTVDLSAVVSQILQGLQERASERVVKMAVEPGLVAQADATLLRTVLENLLGNAWKFTARKSAAAIRFGSQTVTLGNREEKVYFVEDNGAGFDMEYADKLFGSFQRLHGTDEFEGTGIGLASVQRVIHRHGGRIWAHGKVDEGATFLFTLGESESTS